MNGLALEATFRLLCVGGGGALVPHARGLPTESLEILSQLCCGLPKTEMKKKRGGEDFPSGGLQKPIRAQGLFVGGSWGCGEVVGGGVVVGGGWHPLGPLPQLPGPC